jgi:hypothetical protein
MKKSTKLLIAADVILWIITMAPYIFLFGYMVHVYFNGVYNGWNGEYTILYGWDAVRDVFEWIIKGFYVALWPVVIPIMLTVYLGVRDSKKKRNKTEEKKVLWQTTTSNDRLGKGIHYDLKKSTVAMIAVDIVLWVMTLIPYCIMIYYMIDAFFNGVLNGWRSEEVMFYGWEGVRELIDVWLIIGLYVFLLPIVIPLLFSVYLAVRVETEKRKKLRHAEKAISQIS